MGITFAEVEIGGKRYRGSVDTGFSGGVVVSKKVAEETE